MFRHISDLTKEFGDKVEKVLYACKVQNIELRPFKTLISPYVQAQEWVQSRTLADIEEQMYQLRVNGAPFLAHCIDVAVPNLGKPLTDTLPGLSWHQWGEALDCVWIVEEKTIWSPRKRVNGENGYQILAQIASENSVFCGFPSKPEHLQAREVASPLDIYSLTEIDREMQKRFG